MRFQDFKSEILRVVGLLGEKFTFFSSFGTTKISRSLRPSVCTSINAVILINFPEQFDLCFHLNIQIVIKFYNLGDKTFERDLPQFLRK